MAIKRLYDTHPTAMKLEQLFQEMERLGLSLHIGHYGRVIVSDKAYPDKAFHLLDVEASYGEDRSPLSDFPCWLEYKLVYDDGK